MILNEGKLFERSVAIYMRLSKEDGDKEESESISNQRRIIQDYLNKNIAFEKSKEYIDDRIFRC